MKQVTASRHSRYFTNRNSSRLYSSQAKSFNFAGSFPSKLNARSNSVFVGGRPVVIVPYIQKDPAKLDRVMVCWDGSRAAAR